MSLVKGNMTLFEILRVDSQFWLQSSTGRADSSTVRLGCAMLIPNFDSRETWVVLSVALPCSNV